MALFYILCTYWIWHEKNCTSLKYRFKRYFRGGIYIILFALLVYYILVHIYIMYIISPCIIDASCLRNTAYKSLRINIQFLVNICWRMKAINNVILLIHICYVYIFKCSYFLTFFYRIPYFFKQNLLISLFTYYILFNGFYDYDDYDTPNNIDIYIVNVANKK